eukprot:9124149-Pyramimonas_sp.AAC.1
MLSVPIRGRPGARLSMRPWGGPCPKVAHDGVVRHGMGIPYLVHQLAELVQEGLLVCCCVLRGGSHSLGRHGQVLEELVKAYRA